MSNQTVDGLLKKKIARVRRRKYLRGALAVVLVLVIIGMAFHGIKGDLRENLSKISPLFSPKAVTDDLTPGTIDKQEPSADTEKPAESAKPNTEQPSDNTDQIEHTVKITWDGTYDPPESVMITVLHGTDTVTEFELTKESGWSHKWSDPYNAQALKLVGTFPRNVSAVLSTSGEGFTMMGTCSEPEEGDYVPSAGAEGSVMVEGELPQTGFIWIPVLLMFVTGLYLVLSGTTHIVKQRRKIQK